MRYCPFPFLNNYFLLFLYKLFNRILKNKVILYTAINQAIDHCFSRFYTVKDPFYKADIKTPIAISLIRLIKYFLN